MSVAVQRAGVPGVTMPRIDQCAQFNAKLLYIGANCGHLLTRGAKCTQKEARFTNHNLVLDINVSKISRNYNELHFVTPQPMHGEQCFLEK